MNRGSRGRNGRDGGCSLATADLAQGRRLAELQHVGIKVGGKEPDIMLCGIGHDIDLVGGYFASTMVFRDQTQTFEVSP